MRSRRGHAFLRLAVLAVAALGVSSRLVAAPADPPPSLAWRPLGDGVEYVATLLAPRPAFFDSFLHVVRIDPARATLRPRIAALVGGGSRTGREWCDNPRVVAVINAGMYDADLTTHTGYLRVGDRVPTRRWVSKYQSILLLDPRHPGLPAATLRDARPGDTAAAFTDYGTVIQNLRLVRHPGVNVWSSSIRRWSEAAVALDRDGRILFLFSRGPYSMRDFNLLITHLPLGIVRAMHVEGGPEASLSVRGPGLTLDLSGSYETGFNENDGNGRQWPLPNVLVVELRTP